MQIAGRSLRFILWFATKVVLIAVGGFYLLRLAACSALAGSGYDIRKQVPSPDGRTVAYLIWDGGGGAMSRWRQMVVLAPRDVGSEDGRVLVSGKGLDKLDFRWINAKRLAVMVPCGRFQATNYFGSHPKALWVDVQLELPEPPCWEGT